MIEALHVYSGSCRVALYAPAVDLLSGTTCETMGRSLRCVSCGSTSTPSLAPCACGGVLPDSELEYLEILEYLHTKVFGNASGFIGLYTCSDEDWRDIEPQIKRDRAKQRTARSYLHRVGRLDSAAEVEAWLAREYPHQKLAITPISIPCIACEASAEYADILARCRRDNETTAHGYLKWAALHWVTANDLRKTKLPVTMKGTNIEVTYVVNGHPITKDWLPTGPRWLVPDFSGPLQFWRSRSSKEGCLLPTDYNGPLPRGIVKIVDVYDGGSQTFVECGETDALSLVAPLGSGLAKQLVWLPYLGIDKNDPMVTPPAETLPAFLIRRAS